MLRYIRNGQATLGSSTFWRIDDTKAMEAPDYDPIAFLMSPAMLLSLKTFPTPESVDALLKRINEGESA